MSTNFRTINQHPVIQQPIDYKHKIMMLGSCFTHSIGTLFQNKQFDILINPFGITYNPFSIATCIHRIIDGAMFTEADLIHHQGLYSSLLHHGSFNHSDKEQCLYQLNASLQQANESISKIDYLFITLGTHTYFEHIQQSMIVNNCHKLPVKDFIQKKASASQIVEELSTVLQEVKSKNPNCIFVFSVSPIRYMQESAFANSINKANLFVAIEKLLQIFSDAYYFPAYEIVLDDLRDYRFYKEDMLHPNDTAIRYIWTFVENYLLAADAKELMKQVDKIMSMKAHRPINAESEEHKKFLLQVDMEIERIKKQNPTIQFKF